MKHITFQKQVFISMASVNVNHGFDFNKIFIWMGENKIISLMDLNIMCICVVASPIRL